MGETAELVHVARQPILDSRHEVFGYELLYRAAGSDTACSGTLGQASARVIADAVLGIGLDVLTDGRRAFVNLSAETLMADASAVFEPDQVVLEILESVEVTPEVVAMCRSLHERGYALALDDYTPGSPAGALLPYVTFVKLDVLSLAPDLVARTTARLLSRGITVIAEKVETAAALEQARASGCTLFQGYYFCRPVNFSGQTLPASHLAQMRLMTALYRPSVSLSAIEDLLKHDASLTYRILRTVNSAGFGLRREVRSIQEALLLLGLDQVRKWTSVWMLAGANRGPSELVTMAVLRGRTSELVGQAFGRPDGGAGFFLLGLCSLLDVILKQPMARLVEALPLEAEIRGALLGEPNEPRRVLDAVAHYTTGEFALAAACAKMIGVDEGVLATAHTEALRWERELRRADAPSAQAAR